ncbi:MAG TPA: neutral/alkaline non-lysosomal ceramidase N-terminal domain-containing protein [Opitutaceae bacterium]|nr:neutral/alkaline non-lysosomal ceramidase N-terminal domain-containing protein [Opitutaceae bacterium]
MRLSVALVLFTLTAAFSRAEFRAAVVKIDISPKTPQWLMGYGARKSTGVRDPIFHRIAALDDGTTQVFLVASDLCLFSPTVYDDVTAELKKETGIEPRQVWWTVTHSHSTPEVGPPGMYDVLLKGRSEHEWDRDYLALVKSALIAGIKEARTKLAPARLTIGTGVSRANMNRRARDADGKISLGFNPDGPVDRQIGLIRLERPDGTPLGLIANYAMHGTVLGPTMLQISGDGPGVVSAYVEEKLGAPMLYVNGAAGNLAPIYTVQELSKSHIGEFRVLLGDKIIEGNRSLGAANAGVKLTLGETWIETPRREGLGWSEDLRAYGAKSAAGVELVRIPVRFLRINDTVLWASPVELFCEIVLRIRAESPFRHNFFFGYANGWLGYLPTAQAFQDGGYEPRTSPFSAKVEEDYTTGVLAYLQTLHSP